jgi:hypothetical protein
MSDYFMVECFTPRGQDSFAMIKAVYLAEQGSWRTGKKLTSLPPEPIQIGIRSGYLNNLKEMYYADALVITKRLYSALQEAGVDNTESYTCVIRNAETGFTSDDYVAVNLLSLVKSVDLERANINGDLTLEALKAKGYLMFRLEENPGAIMVHKSVKAHLENKGFDMLTFMPAQK